MATTLMSDAAATVPARATARLTKIPPALTMRRTIGRDIQHLLSKPAYDLCRHCQLNGCICKTGLSSGTLSSFRGHFMTLSGMSQLQKRTTYPESGRGFIAHQ